MATKRLPIEWPALPIRYPQGPDPEAKVLDLWEQIRDLVQHLDQLFILITEAHNLNVDELAARISTGTSAPATTPAGVAYIFVDTSAGDIYISKGTASSADWVQVNN